VEVTDLDPRLRQQFNIPSELSGALVMSVRNGTPAYEAGLRTGDVLLEVNRHKIRNTQDAIEQSKKIKDRSLLRVWSKGGSRFIVVQGAKPGDTE
jgi:serine protease Do